MKIGHLRFLVLLAAVSYLPALTFYYVGEEAIFPIASTPAEFGCKPSHWLRLG